MTTFVIFWDRGTAVKTKLVDIWKWPFIQRSLFQHKFNIETTSEWEYWFLEEIFSIPAPPLLTQLYFCREALTISDCLSNLSCILSSHGVQSQLFLKEQLLSTLTIKEAEKEDDIFCLFWILNGPMAIPLSLSPFSSTETFHLLSWQNLSRDWMSYFYFLQFLIDLALINLSMPCRIQWELITFV